MVKFESRNEKYLSPSGAKRAGQEICFYVEVRQQSKVREVHLNLQFDGGEEQLYQMNNEGNNCFRLKLSLQKSGLYFYRFEVVRNDGTFLFVGRGEGGAAVIGDWLPRWKLTVFDADFYTADKWKGGVMYQIFPDRFARVSSQCPDVKVAAKRYFHEDTKEPPYDYTQPERPGGKDYYGGSIAGIQEKLPYLKELGVSIIYFNPIFESNENHRYSTADYLKADPYFATNEEFASFCKKAKEMGIEVILDGVFSHTGADSVYFNKEGHYDSLGAYNSTQSPYYNWYQFEQYPEQYKGWWGFKNLPNVNETCPEFMGFVTGEGGVIETWQNRGAAGWRLDVADELPDEFLENLRKRVKAVDPEAYIVGEVWEHAVEKISYGARRKFLLGKQCDSVMNYPWREAIIQLVRSGNLSSFGESVQTLWEDYPRPALDTLMNILSTHDTMRILSELGQGALPRKMPGSYRMSEQQRQNAIQKLRVAALLQFTLPGIPCIYYGDEIGMEGGADPYCRAFFEWENVGNEIHQYYCLLGQLRTKYRQEFMSDFEWNGICDGVASFTRGKHIKVVLNFSDRALSLQEECLLQSCDGTLLLPQNVGVYYLKEQK